MTTIDPWAEPTLPAAPDVVADHSYPDVTAQTIYGALRRGLLSVSFHDLVAMSDPHNGIRSELRMAHLARANSALEDAGYHWVDGRLVK